jgi:hypothetical protein
MGRRWEWIYDLGFFEIAASAYGLLAMTILSGTAKGRGVVLLLQVGKGAATIPAR